MARKKAGAMGFGKTGSANRSKNTVIARHKHKTHIYRPKVGAHASTLKQSYHQAGISIGNYSEKADPLIG